MTTKFISPTKLQEAWRVSRTFLWRMEKAGLIEPFYIFSRKLYRKNEVERVEGMIERGELRAALRGAAGSNKRTSFITRPTSMSPDGNTHRGHSSKAKDDVPVISTNSPSRANSNNASEKAK